MDRFEYTKYVKQAENDTTIEQDYIDTYKQKVLTHRFKNETKTSRNRHSYLSYDEPNAEENYADLLAKVPWAKRVHGIKGSDAAHKACAKLSETDRFVTSRWR